MKVPILSGIYADINADLGQSYPVNMIPVIEPNGIDDGYLRPSEGIKVLNAATGGLDRGGINWGGIHYRVIGTNLYSIDAAGALTSIGAVSGTDRVKFDYSFSRLAIAADKKLYYYDGATFVQVTDPDLGDCLDVIFIDGYFMTTDGENLVVTELNSPTSIDPLKYGSSEVDPDKIIALHKVRNEVYAINEHTTEVFSNKGGSGFPFTRISSAQMTRGAISRDLTAEIDDAVIFIGARQNEGLAVWLSSIGKTIKISTREIDRIIRKHDKSKHIEKSMIEIRMTGDHQFIYLHLPDETCVYDLVMSQRAGLDIWHIAASNNVNPDIRHDYDARHFTYVYDKWHCGHRTENKIGYLTNNEQHQWNNLIGWSFDVAFLYNEGNAALIRETELITITGNAVLGKDPSIYMRMTKNGITYTMPRYVKAGKQGERNKRLIWRNNGKIENYGSYKFTGNSDAFISVIRMDIQAEALAW